ncbi:peptidoglycan DD-metalloendopeptidase family protein [Neisseria yangbaofengii]|uniref:peptidoglycan DD-metalloendopeptidase family protein n=1 Tax=Neisseria yangbaofengii TaxID=2709396 RepID=UPI0013EDC26A|nr:peptidoglycan DD-metalloendopeptidase family protein [Neisseria yangbaofengii]
MRYKPLLLALLLCFTAPSFAANDSAKEKAATAKKNTQTKKATAPKEAAKATDKKTAIKDKKDSGKTTSAKAEEKANSKPSEKAKAAAKKDDKADNKKTNAKTTDNKKEAAQTKEQAVKKAAAKNTKEAAKPETAAKKDNKNQKEAAKQPAKQEAVKKAADKTETANSATKTNAANDKKTAAAPNKDSDELHAAVSAATNDLEAKQALNKRTASFLVRVNADLKKLQQTRNSLSNINRQQRDAWNKLQQLDKDLTRLKAEVGNTRAQISRFVSGNYKNSQPNAVALFLRNAEPGQKKRFLRYTRYINASNEKVMADLTKQQKELAAQETKINNELSRLKHLQANAQAALKKQGAPNAPEQVESRRQNAAMIKDAKKSVTQKDNEQRLNNLIKDLDKQKAEQRKKEAEARKKAAEARLAAAEKSRQAAKAKEEHAAKERAAMSNLTDEDMKLQAPKSGSFITISNPNSFSRMQGRLKKPVNGMLSGLFGHQRESGEIWKGVFYTTPPAAVNSIAAGNVVYAGELEGYGNVVVVDHGDKYVSVYSGLSEIGVVKGYGVGQGHKIGTSGILPSGEEGLYLEIRYNGQNMNPLSWIN